MKEKKWYQQTGIIVLLTIFLFPIGLFLMWRYSNWGKNTKIIVSAVVAVVVVVALFGPTTAQPTPTPVDNSDTTVSEPSTAQPNLPKEPVNTPPTAPEQPADTAQPTPEEPEKYTGDNLLLKQVEVQLPVKSGSGDTIGQRAYIEMDKEVMQAMVTAEDFQEFFETAIDGKEYSYYTIVFGDGTGIVFTAGQGVLIPYGNVSDDGMISEGIGYIRATEDGGYEYEEK